MRQRLRTQRSVRPESFDPVRPELSRRANVRSGQAASKGFLAGIAFSFLCSAALADAVYFKTGDSLKGLVVEEHRDRIVLSTEEGERTLFRREIDEIFYSEPERNHLTLGNQALEQGEVALARGFYEKALQARPNFTEAEDALQRLNDAERKKEEPPIQDPLGALWRRWGLGLEEGAGAAAISSVREKSLAALAGLELGDALIGVWGESLEFLSAQEAAESLLGPAGTAVKITIRRIVSMPAASSRRRGWPQWELEMAPAGLTVQKVDPAGAAAQAGLLSGDRIVQLGGRPTRYLPLDRARQEIQKSREKGLEVVIHRDLRVHRE